MSAFKTKTLSCILIAALLISLLALSGCASSGRTVPLDQGRTSGDNSHETADNGWVDDWDDQDDTYGWDDDWDYDWDDQDDTYDWDDDGGDSDDPAYTPGVAPELDFVVADVSEPLVMDTYIDDELGGTRFLNIYDNDYLYLFFGQDTVSETEIFRHIDENPKIPGQYNQLLKTFVHSIATKYPDADLRPLDFNIQTLEVVECDEFDLALHSLSLDAYGCYVSAENAIYVPENYTYQPGTWEYQVIMHEFGHAARTVYHSDSKLELIINIQSGSDIIPEEALNSIFTVSLFDYEERDIAYQLQSNMFLILVDCCDGYATSDYLNHSLTYFAKKLDEENGNNNYAMSILKLIGEQREDWANEDYERPQEFYYPIYDYLTKMYLDQYGSSGMKANQVDALVDQMLDIVMFDVPEEYHIDTAEFYRFAHAYSGT